MCKFFLKKIVNKYRLKTVINNDFSKLLYKYIKFDNEAISLIDVGANKGLFYNELKLCYRNAIIKAILIEPIPDCVSILKEKFGENSNLIIAQVAASNTNENKEFYINKYDETSSLLKIRQGIRELANIDIEQKAIIKVNTTKLDSIVIEYNFTPEIINLLKVDVQGFEDRVLLGAVETLKRTEYIWIEVSYKKLYEGSCLFSDIYSILSASGFILVEILDGHRTDQNELIQTNCLFKNIGMKI